MTAAFIDSFAGTISELTQREQGEPMLVLAALGRNGRVSVFERGPRALERSIAALITAGFISSDAGEPYPWCRFYVTDAGNAALRAWRSANDPTYHRRRPVP